MKAILLWYKVTFITFFVLEVQNLDKASILYSYEKFIGTHRQHQWLHHVPCCSWSRQSCEWRSKYVYMNLHLGSDSLHIWIYYIYTQICIFIYVCTYMCVCIYNMDTFSNWTQTRILNSYSWIPVSSPSLGLLPLCNGIVWGRVQFWLSLSVIIPVCALWLVMNVQVECTRYVLHFDFFFKRLKNLIL